MSSDVNANSSDVFVPVIGSLLLLVGFRCGCGLRRRRGVLRCAATLNPKQLRFGGDQGSQSHICAFAIDLML